MSRARSAVELHVKHWNDMNRSEWVALFSPNAVFEDPVGAPPKHGAEAVHNSWDRSFTPGRRWTLHPEFLVGAGDECAVLMRSHGILPDGEHDVVGIEVFRVDHLGRIESIRAFFEQPTDFQLSSYFQVPSS